MPRPAGDRLRRFHLATQSAGSLASEGAEPRDRLKIGRLEPGDAGCGLRSLRPGLLDVQGGDQTCLNSPAGNLEVVVLSAEGAVRNDEPRLRETRVDVVCGDLASDRGADTLEIEQRRELFSPRCLNAAPQSAK